MKSEDIMKGLLIRIKGSDYYAVSEGEEYKCYLRGRFRIEGEGKLPVVGDWITFRLNREKDSHQKTGLILSVEKRKSVFARSVSGGRKKILGANLDYVFLIHSARNPDLNTRLVDRMIVGAENGGIEPVICVNKIDLVEDRSELRKTAEIYEKAGYKFLTCSARDGEGIDQLFSLMKGKISLMAGPSGSGKTTIISVIQPGLDIRIGKVSSRTGKGRHTTSHLELHQLSAGGYLGDTPGIRAFGVELVERNELQNYFLEFGEFRDNCRFNSCIHYREPGCAVKEAVQRSDIAPERYQSYIRMLEEIDQQRPRY